MGCIINNEQVLEILKKSAKTEIKYIKKTREEIGGKKAWNKDREILCREFLKLKEINKINLLQFWFVVCFSGIEYANRPERTSVKMYLESDLPLMFKTSEINIYQPENGCNLSRVCIEYKVI